MDSIIDIHKLPYEERIHLEFWGVRKPFELPIFRDCYHAIENLLNLYVRDDRLWSCMRRESGQFYHWNDKEYRGNSVFKIKVEKDEKEFSNPERFFQDLRDRSFRNFLVIDEMERMFRMNDSYPEFYLSIDLKRGLMRFFLLNFGPSEAWEIEIEIPSVWLESLRTHKFPGNTLDSTGT